MFIVSIMLSSANNFLLARMDKSLSLTDHLEAIAKSLRCGP